MEDESWIVVTRDGAVASEAEGDAPDFACSFRHLQMTDTHPWPSTLDYSRLPSRDEMDEQLAWQAWNPDHEAFQEFSQNFDDFDNYLDAVLPFSGLNERASGSDHGECLLHEDTPAVSGADVPLQQAVSTGSRDTQTGSDGSTATASKSTSGAANRTLPSSSKRALSPGLSGPATSMRHGIANGTYCFQLAIPGSAARPRKARKTFDSMERRKVGDVRNKKACLRCRWLKTSCDGETPCAKCVTARLSCNLRLYKGPCVRLNLSEADCFRVGNSKFFQEIAAVRKYPRWRDHAPLQTILLIRPGVVALNWPSGASCPTLPVVVREFVPGPDDFTSERWRDASGREIVLELPCLAAVDNKATTQALLAWVDDNFELYTKDMVSQGGDFIISATFDEAIRYSISRPGSLVRQALRIWIGSRMAQEFFAVQEDNDLGIGKVVDPLSVHDQQCPVPPVLDHQLDVLMIVEMIKMKNAMLESMRRMIEDRRRNNWYEVYLTMFVLLSNLQYVFQKQQRYQKLHYGTGRANNIGQAVKSYSYKFMQRYHWSAHNLISHFRYVLKGPVPFTLDWSSNPDEHLAGLDPGAVAYVRFISNTVKRRAPELKTTASEARKGHLEGDLFWLCQLFIEPDVDEDWLPIDLFGV